MRALLDVIMVVLNLYTWVVIAAVIFSWLFTFNVVNSRNQFVGMVGGALYQLTEPLLRPIRRFIPTFGGLDVSPIVLPLAIFFLQRVIALYVYPNVI